MSRNWYVLEERARKSVSRGVVSEQIRALNSSSGVFVQQSVGLSSGYDICVPELHTLL